MTDIVWLILSPNGVREMRKNEPRELRANERAVRIQVFVPDAAFKRPPVPVATIDIPESALRMPPVNLDVTVNTPGPKGAEGVCANCYHLQADCQCGQPVRGEPDASDEIAVENDGGQAGIGSSTKTAP